MKNILSKFQASSYVLLASVIIIILALVACPMPGPNIEPDPPDRQAPTPITEPVQLPGGGRALTNNSRNVSPALRELGIAFSEPIQAVESASNPIILRVSASAGTAVGANSEPQEFNVNNSEQVRIQTMFLTLLGVELAMGTSYEVVIPEGVIEDTSGNDIEAETISFSTSTSVPSDIFPPTLVRESSTPAHGSTPSTIPSTVSLVFNENIRIVNPSTIDSAIGLTGGSGSITTVAISSTNPRALDIALSDLAHATEYTITVPLSEVEDLAGNNITAPNTLVFTTPSDEDTTAPVFEADMSTPANNAIVSEIPSTASLVFSENITIDASTIQTVITLSGGDGSESIGTVVVNASNANQLDIAVSGLADNTRYTITVPRTALRDRAGNMPASDIELVFSINTTALILVDSNPSVGSVINALPTSIRLEFSREVIIVDSTTIQTAITLSGGAGSIGTVTTDSMDRTVLNIVLSGLEEAEYTITVPSTAIQDTSLRNPPENIELVFTTDTTAPSFNNSTPVHESQTNMIPNSIALFFNEDMRIVNEGTIANDIILTGSPGSIGTVSVNAMNPHRLDIALDSFGENVYGITLPASAVSDTAGNPLASNVEVSFTVDRTSPAFLDSTPTNNSRQNTIPSTLTLRFNENIHIVTPGSIINEIDISGGAGTVTNAMVNNARPAELSINLSGLVSNTTYTITVPQSSLRDSAGNNLETPVVIAFTLDSTLPAFERSVPVANTTVSTIPSTVSLVFSEPIRVVDLATIQTDITISDGGGSESIGTVAPNASNSAQLDIVVGGLADNTSYTLTVPRSAISDLAGNLPLEDSIIRFTINIINTIVLEHNEAMSVPAHNSLVQTAPSPVTFVFSRNIEIVDRGNIRSLIGITGGTAGSVTVANVEVDSTNRNELDIFLTGLASNTTYTISVPRTAVRDTGNNTLMSNAELTFSLDTTAPQIEDSIPSANALVNSAPTVTLVFSEEIQIIDSSMFSISGSGTTNTESIDSSQADGSNLVLTVSGLNEETYTVTIPSASISDRAGNTLSSDITRSFTFSFDTTPPQFMNVTPNFNTGTIRIRFNEPISLILGGNDLVLRTGSEDTELGIGTEVFAHFAHEDSLFIEDLEFASSTTYTIAIPANTIEDALKNANQEITHESGTITFTTGSLTRPQIDDIVLNRTSGQIVISFTENIQANSGEIRLTAQDLQSASSETTTSFSVGNGAQVAVSGRTITLRGITFADLTQYTIEIPAGVVQYTSNNLFNSLLSDFRSTSETVRPRVRLVSATGNMVSSTTTQITLTFTENIRAGTGNITLTDTSDNSTDTFNVDATMNEVVLRTDAITLLDVSLEPSRTYTITFPAGIVLDTATPANANEEVTGATHTFSTAAPSDTTAPALTANPLTWNNTNDRIEIAFSENITLTNAGNISLENNGGGTVPGTSVVAAGNILVMTINPALADGSYTLILGESAVSDNAGNENARDTESFTIDTTAPALTADPLSINEGYDQITISFNEDITLNGAVTLTDNGGTTEPSIATATHENLVITVTGGRLADDTYTVSIAANAIADSAGNENESAIDTLTFTVDTTAPQIEDSIPSANALVNSAPTVTLVFSEEIQIIDSSMFSISGSGTTNTESIDSSQADGSNLVLTVSGLNEETYTVTIPSASISDRAGNTLSSDITRSFTFSFDTTPPQFMNVTPNFNTGTIRIRFNEPISLILGGNDLVLRTGSEDTELGIGTEVFAHFAHEDSLFIEDLEFASSTTYTIAIPANTIEDALKNANQEITHESGTITFTTGNLTRPQIDDIVLNRISGQIVISFTENIQANSGEIRLTAQDLQSASETTTPFSVGNGAQVAVSGRTITLRGITFADLTQYIIEIPAGVVQYTSNNLFNSLLSDFRSTSETVRPRVRLVSATGNMVSSTTTQITLTFTENIRAGTGDITLTDTSDNSTDTFNIDETMNEVEIETDTITLLGVSLEPSRTYTITFPAGIVLDTATPANANEEVTGTTHTFSTAAPSDTTAPALIDSGAFFLSADRMSVNVSFNEIIHIADASTISITGTNKPDLNTASTMGNILVIPFDIALPSTNNYAISIPAGTVRDNAGNTNDSVITLRFSRGVPPQLTTEDPRINGMGTEITLRFDTDIHIENANSITIAGYTVVNSGLPANILRTNGAELIIPLDSALSAEEHTLSIAPNALHDGFGNMNNQINVTIDRTPPGPNLNDTNPIRINGSSITVRFDEAIDYPEGVTIFSTTGFILTDSTNTIPINSIAFDDDEESDIVLSLASELSAGDHTLTIPSGIVRNYASPTRELNPQIIHTFTISATLPQFESAIPTHNSTINTIPNSVSIIFSEDIEVISAIVARITITGGGSVESAEVNNTNARRLDIELSGLGNGEHSITIPPIAIRDTDGNNPSRNTVLTFTIDIPPPADTMPPNIQTTALTVSENQDDSAVIGTIMATDAESSTLEYSIRGGSTIFEFANPNSGDLSLISGQNLDFEDTPSYSITVEVSDGTNTASADVTITVRDELEITNIDNTSTTVLEITFDRNIMLGGVFSLSIRPPMGTLFRVNRFGMDFDPPGSIAVNGNTLTVTVNTFIFTPGSAYTIFIGAGAIEDLNNIGIFNNGIINREYTAR